MSAPTAFTPNSTHSKIISATSSSSSITLDATDVSSTPSPANAGPSGGHSAILITNAGPNTAFVRWGVGAQTAAVTDMALLSGTTQLFTKGDDVNTIAAICASTHTATIYITCGEGI